MQFSKNVTQLARLHGIEPKDVLFAMLSTSGASIAEAFAVIYRPTVSTSAALATKASNYIGQRPGLKKLIKHLEQQHNTDTDTDNPTPTRRRGRPRKDNPNNESQAEDTPTLDYTNKDAVLQELARIAERCEKESDRLAAIREISNLQRMKQEAAVEDEKRVTFYIPLSVAKSYDLFISLLADAFNWDENQSEKAADVIKPLCRQ